MQSLSIENSIMKVKSLSRIGEFDQGINILQSILIKYPKNLRVKKELENLIAKSYNNNYKNISETQLSNLFNLFKRGLLNEFLIEAEKILEKFPSEFMVWNLLGIAKAKKGDFSDATYSFQKAVELNPRFIDGYNNLGNLLLEQEKYNDAIIWFKKALELNPNSCQLLSNIGNIYLRLRKFEYALESFKKAISINPNHIDALNNLGVTYQHFGASVDAINTFTKVILLKPNFIGAWNNLSYSIHSLNENKINKIFLDLNKEKKIEKHENKKNILKYKLSISKGISDELFNSTIKNFSKEKNITVFNPTYTRSDDKTDINLSQKVVSLVHFGRSGTGLLHSLIDSHPEISTLPSIYLSEYFDQLIWEKITKNGWSFLIENFIQTYEVLFDSRSKNPIKSLEGRMIFNIGFKEGMTKLGKNKDEFLSVDKNQFREEIKYLLDNCKEINQISFFKLVHIAYEKTLNKSNHKKIIFYHIHNPDISSQLNFIQLDKKSNWIMMVRDPIQSCESWLRYSFNQNNHQVCVLRIIKMLTEIDNIIYKKNKSIGVRLEDLKNFPKKTISAICKWIGVQENENLYKMTMQGKKWWGDPTSPDYSIDGMEPFGSISINRNIGSILSKNDQYILNTLFYPFSVRFGYIKENIEQFKSDLKTIKPKIEQIFDFEKVILNRINEDERAFLKSGSYNYFRSILRDRWNILNNFITYPNMIEKLKID